MTVLMAGGKYMHTRCQWMPSLKTIIHANLYVHTPAVGDVQVCVMESGNSHGVNLWTAFMIVIKLFLMVASYVHMQGATNIGRNYQIRI